MSAKIAARAARARGEAPPEHGTEDEVAALAATLIDPAAVKLAAKDGDAYAKTRAKWSNWLWRLYMSDDATAEDAKTQLLAAIESQHTSGRALVRRYPPTARNWTLTRRPLSKDEGE
jgi:hypothetical protein